MGDFSAERYAVDMDVEWRHKDTDQRDGFTAALLDMLLYKKNFSIGRCQNRPVFIRNFSVRITEKIEGKKHCGAGSKQENYPEPNGKKQCSGADEKAHDKNLCHGAVAVRSEHHC